MARRANAAHRTEGPEPGGYGTAAYRRPPEEGAGAGAGRRRRACALSGVRAFRRGLHGRRHCGLGRHRRAGCRAAPPDDLAAPVLLSNMADCDPLHRSVR